MSDNKNFMEKLQVFLNASMKFQSDRIGHESLISVAMAENQKECLKRDMRTLKNSYRKALEESHRTISEELDNIRKNKEKELPLPDSISLESSVKSMTGWIPEGALQHVVLELKRQLESIENNKECFGDLVESMKVNALSIALKRIEWATLGKATNGEDVLK